MLNPYIKTFLAVADIGSFSAAAEKLYLSRVSVKKQIDALESQLGTNLFVRTSQGTSLTDSGKVFYEHAVQLVVMSETAVQETLEAAGILPSTIRVATSILHPWLELMRLWEPFEEAHPEIHFELVPFSDDANSLLRICSHLGRDVDCVVTPNHYLFTREYGFFHIRDIDVNLSMSKDHPLASKERLSWDDLNGQTLLLPKQGTTSVTDMMREDILANHPDISVIDFEGPYDLSVFSMCQKTGCLIEMPQVWAGVHHSLVSVPVAWDYTIPYGILYSSEPSRAMNTLIEALSERIK